MFCCSRASDGGRGNTLDELLDEQMKAMQYALCLHQGVVSLLRHAIPSGAPRHESCQGAPAGTPRDEGDSLPDMPPPGYAPASPVAADSRAAFLMSQHRDGSVHGASVGSGTLTVLGMSLQRAIGPDMTPPSPAPPPPVASLIAGGYALPPRDSLAGSAPGVNVASPRLGAYWSQHPDLLVEQGMPQPTHASPREAFGAETLAKDSGRMVDLATPPPRDWPSGSAHGVTVAAPRVGLGRARGPVIASIQGAPPSGKLCDTSPCHSAPSETRDSSPDFQLISLASDPDPADDTTELGTPQPRDEPSGSALPRTDSDREGRPGTPDVQGVPPSGKPSDASPRHIAPSETPGGDRGITSDLHLRDSPPVRAVSNLSFWFGR